jgi:DegV family protein with EDD domain
MGEFMAKFRAVAREFDTDTILGVTTSSRMSGTFLSAQQAKAELPDLNIELVDGRFISMGTGFQAVVAARMAREGAALGDILARLKRVRESMEIFCAMETLEYLHRGGRIGGAVALHGHPAQPQADLDHGGWPGRGV